MRILSARYPGGGTNDLAGMSDSLSEAFEMMLTVEKPTHAMDMDADNEGEGQIFDTLSGVTVVTDMNHKRNASFARKTLSDLKTIVDHGSLGSACASYWLKQVYGVDYVYVREPI